MGDAELQRIEVERSVWLSVAAAPRSDKPTIILSNSVGSDLRMWDDVVSRLSDKARIVRYDTRGHGRSDLGAGALTIERLGRDVIAVLDALNIDRAVFCGLSLGGLTGQWLGAEAPERFHGLILANTAANFPPPALWLDRARSVREQGMDHLVSPTLDRWLTKSFQDQQPGRTTEVARMIATTSAEGYARCCELLASADLTPLLSQVTAPVRIICGRLDPSTTPARGAELAEAIPDADLVTLDAAHISAIEAADGFAAAAEDFIKRVTIVKTESAGGTAR
jgi:3-oxoadipate enol-lactonase